jgi:membrane protein
MNPFAALEKGWDTAITWSRRRSEVFDHIWTARERYSEVLAGRLAAAIAYYGFFAVFALALIAYAIVGFVLANNAAAVDTVNRFLQQNIPFLDATQIAEARNTVAIVGLIGLVFTGVGWIESLRSSQRAIWGYEQQPGNLFIRRALDLAIMIGIGLLLALSLWVQASINDAVKPVLLWLSPNNVTVGLQETINVIARVVGVVLGLMVNALLAASLLSGVSRLRMPLRRLIPSTLLVAVGLSALSTVGRLYIDFSARRPAYQLVGGTVALLLFLYLFNQLLLYGAALAATSKHGTVVDLAAAAAPADDGDESEGTDDRQPSDTATRDARAESDTTPPIGAARDDDRSMNGSRGHAAPGDAAQDRRTDPASTPAAADREAATEREANAESTDGRPGTAGADRPAHDRPAGARDRRR